MPQTCEHPDHEHRPYHTDKALSVAAHRDIHIFPEPSSQGNVPPTPEVRHRYCTVRILKVYRKSEAHYGSKSHGHKGIAHEIKQDLHGIAPGSKPCGGCIYAIGPCHLHIIPQRCDLICQKNLVGKSHYKFRDTPLYLLKVCLSYALHLRLYLRIIYDRSRYKLWKHAHIGCKAYRALKYHYFLSVHINYV